MNPESMSALEAVAKAIALGILNDYDSMEMRFEGDVLKVSATKVLLPPIIGITFDLSNCKVLGPEDAA